MEVPNIIKEYSDQIPLEDSCGRRKFFNELEALLQEVWAENNFCQIAESEELAKISQKLFEIVNDIKFTQERVWFCGTIEDESNHQAENSLPYLSACLLLLASGIENRIDSCFGQLVDLWNPTFKCHRTLLMQLMENDERLFYFLFALMKLSKKIQLPATFDPLLLGVNLLCEIDFSETVFIDWLCSETVALAFSIQFFKTIHLKFSNMNAIFGSINQALKDEKSVKTSVTNEAEDEVASFVINELHGDQLVENTYTIKKQALVTSIQSSAKSYSLNDLTGFIVRLMNRLESLNAKDLLPFNATILIRIIGEIDKLTD